MIPTKAQLEQAVADNLTQQEAAERFNCAKNTIQRHRRMHGIHWPHQGAVKPSRFAEIDGEWLSLAEIARRYGIDRDAICKRYHAGDRGERLVRPLRDVDTKPDHYEIGFSGEDWRVVVDLARERSPLVASRRFHIPIGAVAAALRGEWERLG